MKQILPVAGSALLLSGLVAATGGGAAPVVPRVLIVCSPGSPGTTEQAQPTMDAFARVAEKAAGWPAGSLNASYYESLEAGLPRLKDPQTVLALVPLAFFEHFGQELDLRPRLEAVPERGESEAEGEIWALVAKSGSLPGPAALAGWELASTAGYAPDFVRNTLLGGWGSVPPDARIGFTPRPLGALRRAASGERVAVLLDGTQTAALASLPFAADLEVIYRSPALPSAFLCTLDERLAEKEARALARGLLVLPETEAGRDLLTSLRLTRFAPVKREMEDPLRKPAGEGAPGRP